MAPAVPPTSAECTEVLNGLWNVIPIEPDDNPSNILPDRVANAYVKVDLVCNFGLKLRCLQCMTKEQLQTP